MADLFDVADTIGKMAAGFEGAILSALADNLREAEAAVQDQLYSGLDGDDCLLSPDYSDDPFFRETEGPWKGRGADYQAWKMDITPPAKGWMLDTPPRPAHVPNLYIDGTFYSKIKASMNGDSLSIGVGSDEKAQEIVAKWGESVLKLGSYAIEHFNYAVLAPRISAFFGQCGW